MKNKFRSRAFMKIKHSINSCITSEQLDSANNMIALHEDIKESDDLFEIYNRKKLELNPDYKWESEIDTNIHRATCGAK